MPESSIALKTTRKVKSCDDRCVHTMCNPSTFRRIEILINNDGI